jgi:opacity protein-like surface antigen
VLRYDGTTLGNLMTKKLIIATLAGAALASTSAMAADMAVKAPVLKAQPSNCAYDIIRANSQIGISAVAGNLDYAEFNQPPAGGGPLANGAFPQGFTLNSEKGWLPGVAVTGSYMSDCSSAISNMYFFGRGTYLDGKTDYYNYTVNVPGKDPAKIWDGDFRIGKGFQVTPNAMLTPYIGAGVHSWERTITAVPGGAFIETYRHGYVGAGLLLQVAAAPGVVLSGYGFGGSTFSPEMDFNPTTSGVAVPHTFGLGTSEIVKAGASIDYAFTPNWHANLGVDYTYFKYGASRQELLPAFGIYEPPSRTYDVRVSAGIGYSFGAPVVAKY